MLDDLGFELGVGILPLWVLMLDGYLKNGVRKVEREGDLKMEGNLQHRICLG